MSSETIRLSISGMSCQHCVASAETALRGVSGVENVNVNLESGEALVTGSAEVETLITALGTAGYESKRS